MGRSTDITTALDRSTEHFKRALEIDPNNREALLKLVYNYCMDGRIETALKLAEPWLAKKKDDKELKAVVAELKKAKAKSARGFKPAEQIVAAYKQIYAWSSCFDGVQK